MIGKIAKVFFGSANDRFIKKQYKTINKINALEPQIEKLSDEELKGKTAYDRYDNYDAIEVPFTDAIPSDYDGVMGVPISFLDKYCPEQFEILGITDRGNQWGLKTKEYTISDTPNFADLNRRGAIGSNGFLVSTYARLLIRKL